jgi:UTP--glucose-1-phosphate uridylyltransferase
MNHISNLIDVVSVRQKRPLGLGHAILMARNVIGNEPFVVLLGDDLVLSEQPCTKQMLNLFNEVGESIVAVQRVPQDQTYQYGIVEGIKQSDHVYKVDRMVEKPAPGTTDSDMAIIGRYILQPDIFDLLEKTTPGHGGEIQLTDALLALAKKRGMYAYEFEGTRFDAGDKLGYLKAIIAYGLRHPEICENFGDHIKQVAAQL